MSISLEDIQIARLDPSNQSANPSLSMVFSVKVLETAYGRATLTELSATVRLNGDPLPYETFRNVIPVSDRVVTAGYNRNLTVGSTILEPVDKQRLYNASQTGNWTFNINLAVIYYLFEGRMLSRRVLFFAYEGYTAI
jgi:hypothetical protein